jgi:hypothetical protein
MIVELYYNRNRMVIHLLIKQFWKEGEEDLLISFVKIIFLLDNEKCFIYLGCETT